MGCLLWRGPNESNQPRGDSVGQNVMIVSCFQQEPRKSPRKTALPVAQGFESRNRVQELNLSRLSQGDLVASSRDQTGCICQREKCSQHFRNRSRDHHTPPRPVND